MCFLHPDLINNTFYHEEDILTQPDMTREVTMLSKALIATVLIQTTDESFLNLI